MIGSRSVACAFLHASWNAFEAAILNDNSLESTSWNEPKVREALISTIGYPATKPLLYASFNPFCTHGIYSFGITQPTILFTNLLLGFSFRSAAISSSSSSLYGSKEITT
jgi:hypothetical protein